MKCLILRSFFILLALCCVIGFFMAGDVRNGWLQVLFGLLIVNCFGLENLTDEVELEHLQNINNSEAVQQTETLQIRGNNDNVESSRESGNTEGN